MTRGGLRSRSEDSRGGSTMSSLQTTLKSTLKLLKVLHRRAVVSTRDKREMKSHKLDVSRASFAVNAVCLAMGSNDKCSVPKAPTKEEMSFSTYTAKRKLNRLRRAACQLFTSQAVVKAIQRLELEVEARRLLVRKDRHLWKDIGKVL